MEISSPSFVCKGCQSESLWVVIKNVDMKGDMGKIRVSRSSKVTVAEL